MFELAQFVDVTEIAYEVNTGYEKASIEKVFVCNDVNDFWLARLMTGFGEGYEPEEGSYIVEIDKIEKESKTEKLTLERVKRLLEDDCFENWTYEVFNSRADAIEYIDGGYGIN